MTSFRRESRWGTMEVVTTLPHGRALTVADLELMPDDGHRYELIDGTLVVTPAPSARHQGVLGRLHVRLVSACPPELRVLLAPFDVVLGDDTSVQPDLLVARRSDVAEANLPGTPLLAIEILSPSTRLVDLNLKKARFESAGVASYGVIDPGVPRLLAWHLSGGAYVEVADVVHDEEWTSTEPYPVTLVPNELLDD